MELPDLFRYVAALLILAALFGGLTRFRLRLGLKPAGDSGEPAPDRVEGSMLAGLRLWLSQRMARARQDEADLLAGLRGDPRWRFTVMARERYSDFLRWTGAHGLPRSAATTPDELMRAWEGRGGPADREAIATITRVYDAARYGRAPLDEEEARRMTEAWERLARSDAQTARE
jgi:hypothetical protein